MTISTKNGKYFCLLNLLVIITILAVPVKTFFTKTHNSEYLLRLNEVTHYVTEGFSLETDISGALEFPADSNRNPRGEALGGDRHAFLRPGEALYKEFTITALFNYTEQYDALKVSPNIIPGIMLHRLGDNYEIYLNGHLVISEWHVYNDRIMFHKLVRDKAYPINPNFFIRGENILTFRIYGDPSTVDTGLTIVDKYAIDNMQTFSSFDIQQIVLAGIYLAVAVIFAVIFLLYRGKRLNLWFSMTALSVSIYTFFRANLFESVFHDYEILVRLEVFSLFSFAFLSTIMIYTTGKEKFNLGMKVCTGIYTAFCAALILPGREFLIDLIKLFYFVLAPMIVYVFVSSLCIPMMRDMKNYKREGVPGYIQRILFGTLRGNMLIAAFMPIIMALFDQIAYVILTSQDILLSQYVFLFFFSNATFALASDNAEMHNKLVVISGELRALVSERESQLAQKSGEVEEAKTAQMRFRETVSREIRAPIGEVIGAIELQMLRSGMTADTVNWLKRLLDAQRGIRKKLEDFLGDEAEYSEIANSKHHFEVSDARYDRASITSNPGATRHLFVINPKSFVTLKDLKNFLLRIETCFSAGYRAEYKVYISRYPRDAYAAVHRYLSATPTDETARVYAVGGDGILFDCLNGLAHFPNAELVPIPYGNANDFVRSFGADNMELFRDIKLMSKSPSRLVDAILCGQQYALTFCAIGIEARAVQVFSNTIERINSSKARNFVPLLYKLGAVKSLVDGSQNSMDYRVTFDGEDFSDDYLFLSIGNVALNGGNNIPNPFAVPDDGILDVITCKSSSIINSLRMLPAYTSGQFSKFPDYFKHHLLKEMHCESDKLMSVVLDGETFYTHELDLKILPKTVKIVSPNGIGFADYSQTAKGARKT